MITPRTCISCNSEDNGVGMFLHNAGCSYLRELRHETCLLQTYDFDMDTQDWADEYGRCFLCDAIVQTGEDEDGELWWLCSSCSGGVPWTEIPAPPSCHDDDDDLQSIASIQTTYGVMGVESRPIMTPSFMTVNPLTDPGEDSMTENKFLDGMTPADITRLNESITEDNDPLNECECGHMLSEHDQGVCQRYSCYVMNEWCDCNEFEGKRVYRDPKTVQGDKDHTWLVDRDDYVDPEEGPMDLYIGDFLCVPRVKAGQVMKIKTWPYTQMKSYNGNLDVDFRTTAFYPVTDDKVDPCENGHKKVRSDYTILTMPPKSQWICERCGTEGVDTAEYVPNEYQQIKVRFGK